MVKHRFLFEPGQWLGEGKVLVISQEEELKFYTRWSCQEQKNGIIIATQEIEFANGQDKTSNHFTLSHLTFDGFMMKLHNELFGEVLGKGVVSEKAIAWEFHGKDLAFEGFEVCQLQGDGSYLTRAEYTSSGEPHTVITGKLWKKSP